MSSRYYLVRIPKGWFGLIKKRMAQRNIWAMSHYVDNVLDDHSDYDETKWRFIIADNPGTHFMSIRLTTRDRAKKIAEKEMLRVSDVIRRAIARDLARDVDSVKEGE